MNAFCSGCGQPVPQEVRFCGRCGTPTANVTVTTPPLAPQTHGGVRCKTCEVGVLRLEKQHRMSTPVVAIGYILLVPSILGIIFAVVMLIVAGSAGSIADSATKDAATKTLHQAGVAEPVVQKVLSSQRLTDTDRAALTRSQREAVEATQSSITASEVGRGAGTVIAGGVIIFLGLASFVSGLLGWLLIMKKKVLHCTSCGAVVAAS